MNYKKKQEKHAGTGHQCRECRFGHYNMECCNYKGEPFMIYCKHGQKGYSPAKGQNVTYSDIAACEFFEEGKRKETL